MAESYFKNTQRELRDLNPQGKQLLLIRGYFQIKSLSQQINLKIQIRRMANASLITRDVPAMTQETGNTYESVVIIGKRARQISTKLKEELNSKLAEFATTVDNLEEVFENREQIEISKFYERMPKATTIATEEFIETEKKEKELGIYKGEKDSNQSKQMKIRHKQEQEIN
eukprot:TRINITY_DN13223_c2_g1_i1.p2 TRINITY_DN13223_c2_g1~~TRINITY_DN13223_c2_g1_i1.p2  ORF type:complete len:201 (-),score=13.83 TRINITY_DN13223_c2_g1_i1:40-552(-)